MAVSGKTAAPHEIPYYLGTDKPPDMAAVTKAIADQAHARLDAIALKQLASGTKKQIIVCNSSGVPTYVPVGGDLTINEAGELQLGAGVVGTTELASGVVAALSDERTPKANSVDSSKVVDGSVTDADLASPNNAAYKTLQLALMRMPAATGEGTWMFSPEAGFWKAGAALTGAQTPIVIALEPTDAEVGGLAQKLRLRVGFLNAGAAQTKNFAVSLRQVSSIEYKEAHHTIILSATELGKTTIESPGANSRSQKAGADFSIPEAGIYLLVVAISGSVVAASEPIITVELQSHNV